MNKLATMTAVAALSLGFGGVAYAGDCPVNPADFDDGDIASIGGLDFNVVKGTEGDDVPLDGVDVKSWAAET